MATKVVIKNDFFALFILRCVKIAIKGVEVMKN